MTYLCYGEVRPVLVERNGARLERFVFCDESSGAGRGAKGMYPLLPSCEPFEIDAVMFEEAWEDAV